MQCDPQKPEKRRREDPQSKRPSDFEIADSEPGQDEHDRAGEQHRPYREYRPPPALRLRMASVQDGLEGEDQQVGDKGRADEQQGERGQGKALCLNGAFQRGPLLAGMPKLRPSGDKTLLKSPAGLFQHLHEFARVLFRQRSHRHHLPQFRGENSGFSSGSPSFRCGAQRTRGTRSDGTS